MITRALRTWISFDLAVILLVFASNGRAAADIGYAITGGGVLTSTLYTIDTSSGSTTPIGQVTVGGTPVLLSALAYNSGTLYGAINSPTASALVTINTANGTATQVGGNFFTSGVSVTALSFDPAGTTLYAYSKTQGEALYTVDTSSGSAKIVGGSGISSSGDGMAVSPKGGTGYSTGTIFFAGKGASGTLYTLSSSTGSATSFSTLNGSPPPLGAGAQIKGMAYSTDGTLYGIDIAMSTFTADLVFIDPVSGLITEVGGTTTGLTALAFVTPEPGSLTLLGLPAAGWFLWNIVSRKRSKGKS